MTKRYNRTIPITQEEKPYSPNNREFPINWRMDAVRKLILEKADEKETNLAELSRKIGKNHAYLQQFIHRNVPAHLPEEPRILLALELGVDENLLRGKKMKIPKLGSGNHISVPSQSSFAMSNSENNLSVNQKDGAGIVSGTRLIGEQDLPVFGTAQGGSGALILTNQAVDWVVRPEPLRRVKDGYGIIVTGDSMAPMHKSGSTALVNPHLPWRAGDTCVFRSHHDDGTVHAIIKELRRFTDDLWYVRQYHPARDFTLKRAEWQVCHVTVGNYFSR